MKIAVTGLSGFLGYYLLKTNFFSDFDLIDLHRDKLDLIDSKNIAAILEKLDPDVILHLAAKTHIDNCENDKALGSQSETWKTNVIIQSNTPNYCEFNNPGDLKLRINDLEVDVLVDNIVGLISFVNEIRTKFPGFVRDYRYLHITETHKWNHNPEAQG